MRKLSGISKNVEDAEKRSVKNMLKMLVCACGTVEELMVGEK